MTEKKIVRVEATVLKQMSTQIEKMQNELQALIETSNQKPKPKFKLWVLHREKGVKTYFSSIHQDNENAEKTSLVKTMITLSERARIAILYNNQTKQEIFRVYYN
jgi:hypothetical protein